MIMRVNVIHSFLYLRFYGNGHIFDAEPKYNKKNLLYGNTNFEEKQYIKQELMISVL